MRPIRAIVCATVLASAALACSNEENQPPPRAAAPQPPPSPHASVADRARSLVLAADLQLKDLQEVRSHSTDDNQRESLSRQIGDVSINRDRLNAELTIGPPDDRQIALDMKSLQRAMHGEGTGVTQPQPQQPPQPQTLPQQQPQEPPPGPPPENQPR